MQIELFDLPPIPSIKSPLGYPGGKRKLCVLLDEYLPKGLTNMVSPFMGGGSVELYCTGKLIHVEAYDNFEPLMNFWKFFIEDSKKLIDFVRTIYPLPFERRKYYDKTGLAKGLPDFDNSSLTDFERAGVYLCVNKQSFRGWGLAAPQSQFEELKPLSFFNKWETWQNTYITVGCSDYIPVIENANGKFLYLDPPYVDKEHFYGAYKDKAQFDHKKLAELLHNTSSKWIMSYGDHQLIRDLYKDYTILEPQWKYMVRRNADQKSEELLILNL